MSINKLLISSSVAIVLTGCGGGDINIAPTNETAIGDTVTNINNQGATNTEVSCASYTLAGTVSQGSYDGTNCIYSKGFVDIDNPLTFDLAVPNIGDGVHVFEGSLVVGVDYATDAELSAAGLSEGGDGPVLTIAAGATLAFRSADDFMVINRGSQLRANGTKAEPITLTSQTDAVFGTVGAEDVGEWGGLVINGFGVTNKCSYVGTYPHVTTSDCHVASEGKADVGESHYGGDNNADNSGVMKYLVVKHTGAEVAPGNELNGIAFNAVGNGTLIENLEVYSVYDDGIEFFGGAVDITNYVAVYVRDDAIDIDEGYRGTITNALVIQSETDGNRCVESDGIGSYSSKDEATIADFIARGLNSQATIKNLTCIISANQTGTHEEGQGLRIREAHFPIIQNAIVTGSYGPDELTGDPDYNWCFRLDNEGLQAAQDDDLEVSSSILACQDLTKGNSLPNGTTTADWLKASGNLLYQTAEAGDDPTAASNAELVILDGFYSVPVADMVVGTETIPTPVGSSIIGAVAADNDWTADWTYGLHDGRRAQPLWFE